MRNSLRRASRELALLAADPRAGGERLGRRAFWKIASRFTPVIAVDRDDLRYFVSTADRTVGRHMFVNHRTRERDIDRVFSALEGVAGLGGDLGGRTVVEVGANIGGHTLELLKRYGAGRVVAIEPNPVNAAILRQNVLANDLGDRVEVLELALSNVHGDVRLELSDTNSGDHRVRVVDPASDGSVESQRATIPVHAASFDSLMEAGEIDLESTGLVWIDAQGHEGHILDGARRLLQSKVPIMMEYWPYGLRRAGGLDLLHSLIAEHYSHVIDLRAPDDGPAEVIAATQVAHLESRYGWDGSTVEGVPATDLILLRMPVGPGSATTT